MGFQKRWDVIQIKQALGAIMSEVRSPYNDGFTAMSCKHDLYVLKCFIEDHYNDLPKFTGEDEWEQQRIVNTLKK